MDNYKEISFNTLSRKVSYSLWWTFIQWNQRNLRNTEIGLGQYKYTTDIPAMVREQLDKIMNAVYC